MTKTKIDLEFPTHQFNGKFRNPWGKGRMASFKDLFRWWWERSVLGNKPKDPNYPDGYGFLSHFNGEIPSLKTDQLGFTYIGHATGLLHLGNKTILTDPFFSKRSSPVSFAGPKRIIEPALPLSTVKTLHDATIITHNHFDHLDMPSIKALGNDNTYFIPLGVGSLLQKNGITNFVEMDWGDCASMDDLQFTCLPTQHFSGRGGYADINRTLWCSWMVENKRRRIFFAGDTGYSPVFREIGDYYKEIDLAILPIGAYIPEYIMKEVHINPKEAVDIALDLNAKKAAAIHWGTLKLSDEPMDEPPKLIKDEISKRGLADNYFMIVQHGETFII